MTGGDGGARCGDDPLRVEVGPVRAEVSPDLWGLFLEDLNSAFDGGLNAELVRNGDFEFGPDDHPGWHALTAWSIEGFVEVLREDPVHPRNAHYARLGGPAALTNEGWDSIPAPAGRTFRLSLATWGVRGPAVLRAALVDDAGAELAATDLAVPDRGWHWLAADLTVPAPATGAGSARARLRLSVTDGTVVEIDAVSLRPLGDDGEPLTFRPDLVAALRDLRPSFVRFPGGCLAHGLGLENMYHWKSTVGPRHERSQIPSLWHDHQSRQLGYLELFELCELLGATPMPVVAAGVCCQNLRGRARAIPMAQMPAYVQDVLDLVEFADGGPDTPWGARRAELGHPTPFGLRYLGVGNEDEITDEFRERYALIEDAVRERHPQVTVIGTSGAWPTGEDFEAGWAFARERGTAVVDEHAYRTPRWFHQSVDRYDDHPRTGPQVYFGEYAARTSTVRSALAEAAFMIGMERNGDVVRLASYAPLLARVGGTQWVPDLLYFDAERVLPSASYHVQRMFGADRGTHAHDVRLDGAEPVPVVVPATGTVRLRSPGARVRWTGIVVDGVPHDDVTTGPGTEEVVLADVDPASTTVELGAVRTAGHEGVEVLLGGTGTQDHLAVVLGSWDNKSTVVNRWDDGVSADTVAPVAWSGIRTGDEHRVLLTARGTSVRVHVDGELRHDEQRDLRPEHRVVAGVLSRVRDGATEHVVRLVNATGSTRETHVVPPVGASWGSGTGEVLAGAGPDEGAPFAASPALPRPAAVTVADGVARLVLPPWSFTVATLR